MNNFAGINDGSTEAAMTLLAMGDPMFQLKTSTEGMISFMGQSLAHTFWVHLRSDGAVAAKLFHVLLHSRRPRVFYAFSPAEL